MGRKKDVLDDVMDIVSGKIFDEVSTNGNEAHEATAVDDRRHDGDDGDDGDDGGEPIAPKGRKQRTFTTVTAPKGEKKVHAPKPEPKSEPKSEPTDE